MTCNRRWRMKGKRMLAGGGPHGAQAPAIAERRSHGTGQFAGFDVIIYCMDAIDQRLVALDRASTTERDGSACRSLVGAKALPSEACRRPHEVGAGTAGEVFIERKPILGHVNHTAVALQGDQLLEATGTDCCGI